MVKRLSDGRSMLNVGCGTRMHWDWNNVDFSPYARLRRNRPLALLLELTGFLSDVRRERLARVDPDIVAKDLTKGIPFEARTFDVVYHAHVLEHFPRAAAVGFLRECHRVLKPGGVIRVVVPDLEQLVKLYQNALDGVTCEEATEESRTAYDSTMDELFDQMTRDHVVGTDEQQPWVRVVERVVRGDASQVGDRHRWAYDRYSLGRGLTDAGFVRPTRFSAGESWISGWRDFNLDTESDGRPHKPYSLYMEARKEDETD